ncbi:hypothetical protein BESB_060330 [Besnoitia besnoiti]|uniref:Transmembrane protein n=1 Tax=Besnoitia besnoiti TaxID=94643 RepID=A0A2A9MGQ4_BESBE|nr:hypothetical protein BESB_060330 [Besnoitia besnoiti]PFH35146.1 hypothetical protein BESB_060330 [Besnoitia besnoiti]
MMLVTLIVCFAAVVSWYACGALSAQQPEDAEKGDHTGKRKVFRPASKQDSMNPPPKEGSDIVGGVDLRLAALAGSVDDVYYASVWTKIFNQMSSLRSWPRWWFTPSPSKLASVGTSQESLRDWRRGIFKPVRAYRATSLRRGLEATAALPAGLEATAALPAGLEATAALPAGLEARDDENHVGYDAPAHPLSASFFPAQVYAAISSCAQYLSKGLRGVSPPGVGDAEAADGGLSDSAVTARLMEAAPRWRAPETFHVATREAPAAPARYQPGGAY